MITLPKLQVLAEGSNTASDLTKIADLIQSKKPGWKITTNDPEGKRGEGEGPRIIFSEKSHRAKVAFEKGEFTFSFEQKAKGWGAMWNKVASGKTAQDLMDQINANLK